MNHNYHAKSDSFWRHRIHLLVSSDWWNFDLETDIVIRSVKKVAISPRVLPLFLTNLLIKPEQSTGLDRVDVWANAVSFTSLYFVVRYSLLFSNANIRSHSHPNSYGVSVTRFTYPYYSWDTVSINDSRNGASVVRRSIFSWWSSSSPSHFPSQKTHTRSATETVRSTRMESWNLKILLDFFLRERIEYEKVSITFSWTLPILSRYQRE